LFTSLGDSWKLKKRMTLLSPFSSHRLDPS